MEALEIVGSYLMSETPAPGMEHQQHLFVLGDAEGPGEVPPGHVALPCDLELEIVVAAPERAPLPVPPLDGLIAHRLRISA